MGDEGYFDWRENMERLQQEREQQVQALLQETRRLREENDVLMICPHCSHAIWFWLRRVLSTKFIKPKSPHTRVA